MIKIKVIGLKDRPQYTPNAGDAHSIANNALRYMANKGITAKKTVKGTIALLSNINKPTHNKKNPLTKEEVERLCNELRTQLGQFYYNTYFEITPEYKEEQ